MFNLGNVVGNIGKNLGIGELGVSEWINGQQAPNKAGQVAATVANNATNGGYVGIGSNLSLPAIGSGILPGVADSALGGPVGGSSATSVGGGAGGRATAYDPAALAYYDDQERLARQSLDRLNNQRGIGLGNVQNSYQSALNQLLGSNAQAERDAGLTRQRTIDDNVTARANVDQTVARQAQGLRRLLGNSSSAAQYAAPLAVARQGNEQQGAIQTSFGRNLQNIDIADEDRKRAFGSAQEDLNRQRTAQENQLNAGLLQTEAQINEQLSNIALQRAQARGQNYAQARGALTPFNDRVSALLSQIDQLGANPAISAKNVNFTAPTLDQYNTSGIAVRQGQTPAQSAAGQYAGLLQSDDERRRRLF